MTDQPTPPGADDEQAARWARREHLAVLVSRAARGRLLPAEGMMLRAAVDAELTDAEQAHTLAALARERATHWLDRAQEIEGDRDRLQQDKAALQRSVRTLMRTQRREHDRAEQAEAILRDLVAQTEVVHAYAGQGGHDTLGADYSCAGCALAARARQHLAGGA